MSLLSGGGPTGLTAANLLGSLGIRVLLVERNPSTSDDAKAISLDEESLRSLQLVGLDEAVYPIILPGTGTRYFGADGRALTHARGDGLRRFGHPFKNSFPQPALERVLRQGLDRYPATRVAVVLGDRMARDTPGRETVADADGKLETLLGGRPGAFVLIRPDRVVAACFTVGSASHVAARLQAAGVTDRANGVRPDSSADRSPVAPPDEAELQQRSA